MAKRQGVLTLGLRARELGSWCSGTAWTPTSRICGNVSANLAAALGTEVEWHDAAVLCERIVERFQHAPSFAYENARNGIQTDDIVHQLR